MNSRFDHVSRNIPTGAIIETQKLISSNFLSLSFSSLLFPAQIQTKCQSQLVTWLFPLMRTTSNNTILGLTHLTVKKRCEEFRLVNISTTRIRDKNNFIAQLIASSFNYRSRELIIWVFNYLSELITCKSSPLKFMQVSQELVIKLIVKLLTSFQTFPFPHFDKKCCWSSSRLHNFLSDDKSYCFVSSLTPSSSFLSLLLFLHTSPSSSFFFLSFSLSAELSKSFPSPSTLFDPVGEDH